MALSAAEIEKLNQEFASQPAEAVVAWAWKRFGRKAALASSFGAEDMALIHMAAAASGDFRVFTLDTGRLHEETYEVMEAARRRYGIAVEPYFPDREKVEALEKAKGLYSFRESIENRKECCGIRKVEPLQRALAGAEAWLTGLRREQAVTRSDLKKIEIDGSQGGILKINPLADWTEKQVWDYVKANGIPYNRLHDAGFPSIGCSPCTRAVKPGEDVRSGRWWWERPDHKECGLHGRKSAGR